MRIVQQILITLLRNVKVKLLPRAGTNGNSPRGRALQEGKNLISRLPRYNVVLRDIFLLPWRDEPDAAYRWGGDRRPERLSGGGLAHGNRVPKVFEVGIKTIRASGGQECVAQAGKAGRSLTFSVYLPHRVPHDGAFATTQAKREATQCTIRKPFR